MPRIICISNRVALPDPKTGTIKAGGLAVGIRAAMDSHGGGIWFGWNGDIIDETGPKTLDVARHGDIRFLTTPLTRREYDDYYKAMANENLWPLMHELGDHIDPRPDAFATYKDVNRQFARMIKPHLRPDDVIWVHDYHLIPLGRELRAMGVQNKIGFFNHIPMASVDFVHSPAVPSYLRIQYRELMSDLFSYDLVGFQSFRDYENFTSFFSGAPRCATRFKGETLSYNGRRTAFGVFPISIETHEITMAAKAGKMMDSTPTDPDVRTIIGAERLDYTKGLTHRLKGFYEFLRAHPEERAKIAYHQITPLSRADIAQYKKTIEKTRHIASKINEDFGDDEHCPLAYREDGVPRPQLMALFRRSDIGLVTPLIDGQNLVAKEYLAAQDPRDPGMLILSRTAGAAEELAECGVLCVDPRDPADIAAKIEQALSMTRAERIEVYRRAIAHLYNNDIEHWARAFLDVLDDAPAQQPRPHTSATSGIFSKILPLARPRPGTVGRGPR